MKKEMIKRIKKFKEPRCYIIVTNEGVMFNGYSDEILSMITMQIRELRNSFPKEAFENVLKYGLMTSEELEKAKNDAMKEMMEKLFGEEEENEQSNS